MKKTKPVGKPNKETKPVRRLVAVVEKEVRDESLSLSPKRITEGASLETALLRKILARQEEFQQLPH